MSTEDSQDSILSQKEAEKCATSLNLIFNNAVFFGAHHPSTASAADNFADIINSISVDQTTFLKNGESFYFEKWGIDSRINQQRTLAQFNKSGVESITFRRGITPEDVKLFISFYMESVTETHSADSIIDQLSENKITTLLVNYITFQKVTRDEKIVDADAVTTGYGELPGLSANADIDSFFVSAEERDSEEVNSRPIVPTFRSEHSDAFELTSLFGDILGSGSGGGGSAGGSADFVGEGSGKQMSVSHLLSSHSSAISMLTGEGTGTGTGSGEWGVPNVKEQFKALGVEVAQGKMEDGTPINYDELFESLFSLSESVKQNSEISTRIKTIEERDEILTEIEELTFDTIVQIVRREFEKGKPSVKKLSFMLRRIAPSGTELRKLLPKLKQQLLDDGYSVSDFLELSIELEQDLSSEHALDGLFNEAADFGVSRDELISTIMENPGESSRLLLQAAEIQKRLGEGHTVSGYIEKMIEDMTSSAVIDQIGNVSDDNIHEALTGIITSFENNVLGKLRKSDAEHKFVDDLSQRLKDQFPQTVERIKSEWLVNKIGNGSILNEDELLTAISQVARDKNEIQHFKSKSGSFGEKFGYSPEDVERILRRTKEQEELRKRRSELHVLSAKSTVHFIKRYIEEFKRYGHPFSLVMLSSKSGLDESLKFVDRVSLFITDTFRTLDIVGQVTVKGKGHPLVILPMTGSEGLTALRDRFSAIPGAGEYIISAVAIDAIHRSTQFELIMKKLIKKHVLLRNEFDKKSEEEK